MKGEEILVLLCLIVQVNRITQRGKGTSLSVKKHTITCTKLCKLSIVIGGVVDLIGHIKIRGYIERHALQRAPNNPQQRKADRILPRRVNRMAGRAIRESKISN